MTTQLIDLSDDATLVIGAIRRAGGRPLIVGGAVRDALNGTRDSKDIDIEVHGGVQKGRLLSELRRVGTVNEYGAAFGVIAVRTDSEGFDVSFPRTESRSGSGHTGFSVQMGGNITERDAFSRRDFTINALGWDPATGEVIDYFGGRIDLEAGVLRHVSDAFSDDPLRVLRGVQLASRFNLTLAPKTALLCRSISHRFAELPVERVWGEWQKIATRGTHVSAALRVLEDSGWLRHFPELAALRGIRQDPVWHPEGDVFTHAGLSADAAAAACDEDGWEGIDRHVAVLGALLHDAGKVTHTQTTGSGRITSHGHAAAGVEPARLFLECIGAPRYLAELIVPIVREHMAHVGTKTPPSKAAVRRLIRRLSGDGTGPTLLDWARVVAADCAGRGTGAKPNAAEPYLRVARELGGIAPTAGIITGADLLGRGLTPGPQFKEILADALAAQDNGDFDAETAGEWLGNYLTGNEIK